MPASALAVSRPCQADDGVEIAAMLRPHDRMLRPLDRSCRSVRDLAPEEIIVLRAYLDASGQRTDRGRDRGFSVPICRAETDRMDSRRKGGWRRRSSLTVLPPSRPFCQSRSETRRLGAGA